jgi:hypothetical protein
MKALTFSQAAKALALSVSSAAAIGNGAAASNGAVPSEVEMCYLMRKHHAV